MLPASEPGRTTNDRQGDDSRSEQSSQGNSSCCLWCICRKACVREVMHDDYPIYINILFSPIFPAIFPGGPVLAGTRMSPFLIYWS